MAAVRNLQAYSHEGAVLWEANFPDEVDYYGQIWSRFPLVVDSFSSFRCEIDSTNGNIISRQFFKWVFTRPQCRVNLASSSMGGRLSQAFEPKGIK